MTETLTPTAPIGEIVAHHPAAAQVFRRYRLDFCCGGAKPLSEVCAEKSLDPETVLAEVREAEADAPATSVPVEERDWTTAPLTELCQHIIATHHAYLRTELPRLSMLVTKIARVHAENHPELADVRDTFLALCDELAVHMEKEEKILFPYIARLETAWDYHEDPPEEDPSETIRELEAEHDGAGEVLRRLEALTDSYSVPADACPTFESVFESLAHLEANTHLHIHLENNILHPRTLALTEKAREGTGDCGCGSSRSA